MAKKRKTSLNKKRILRDDAFEGTRQTMSEFGRAGKASRWLCKTFKLARKNKSDRDAYARLTKVMLKLIHSDPVNGRGNRRPMKGESALLEGFNFNRYTSLQNAFRAPYTVMLNQNALRVTITFPAFHARSMVETASGATAFRLTAIAASLNLEEYSSIAEPVETNIMDINTDLRETMQLHVPIEGYDPADLVFVALGIELFRGVKGVYEPLDKKQNALAVVKAFPAVGVTH